MYSLETVAYLGPSHSISRSGKEDRLEPGERTLKEDEVMTRKDTIKPRDLNVPAMLKKASGAHGKTKKAIRRLEKVALLKRYTGVETGSSYIALSLNARWVKIGPVAQR